MDRCGWEGLDEFAVMADFVNTLDSNTGTGQILSKVVLNVRCKNTGLLKTSQVSSVAFRRDKIDGRRIQRIQKECFVSSSALDRILSSDRLPSLPEIALKIVEIAKRPDADFGELVEAIRMDPALAGRIVKTANSALLGMRSRATSIETAVPRLGTTMIRALVLGFSLAEYQGRKSIDLRPWYQDIWRHSLTQAAAAEALRNDKTDESISATGSLQLFFRISAVSRCCTRFGEEYVDNVLDVKDERLPIERERSYYGFTHVDVSVAICRKWNLDDVIIESIGLHHVSAQKAIPLRFMSATSMTAGLITAAQFAEYLEEVPHNLSASRENLERLLMQVFAFRPSEIFRLLADVDARMGELAATLAVDVGITTSREKILADAQELLSQIAVTSQLRLISGQHLSADNSEPAPRKKPTPTPTRTNSNPGKIRSPSSSTSLSPTSLSPQLCSRLSEPACRWVSCSSTWMSSSS